STSTSATVTKIGTSTSSSNRVLNYSNASTKSTAAVQRVKSIKSAQEFSSMVYQEQGKMEFISLSDVENMYNGFSSKFKDNSIKDATYAEKTNFTNSNLTDLETARVQMESDIETNMDALKSAYNGTHPAVSQASDQYESLKAAYINSLNSSNDPQIMSMKSQAELLDTCVTQMEGRISACNQRISQTNMQITRQTSAISSISGQIATYDNQIKILEKMSMEDLGPYAETVMSELATLKEIKNSAEQRKSEMETSNRNLRTKLNALNQQKTNDQTSLSTFRIEQHKVENDIRLTQDAKVRDALNAMHESKQTLEAIRGRVIQEINSNNQILEHKLQGVESQISDFRHNLAISGTGGSGAAYNGEIPMGDGTRSPEEQQAINIVETGAIKGNYSKQQAGTAQNAETISIDSYSENKSKEISASLTSGAFRTLFSHAANISSELSSKMTDTKGEMDNEQSKIEMLDSKIAQYKQSVSALQGKLNGVEANLETLKEAKEQLDGVNVLLLNGYRMQAFRRQKAQIETETQRMIKEKEHLEEEIESKEQGAEFRRYSAMQDERQAYENEYAAMYEQLQAEAEEAQKQNPDRFEDV
ncbi:hypothetical protein IJ531_03990, partial [bacterium]|nr:hypothetical protein [bacterium]